MGHAASPPGDSQGEALCLPSLLAGKKDSLHALSNPSSSSFLLFQHHPLPLQPSKAPKIDQQPYFHLSGLEIIDQLGLMVGRQFGKRFQFHNDRFIADIIRLIFL